MPTGYSNNKDNRGVELEREKRAKEQQERVRKQHLASDLAAKKNFLFSTKTTIDMKSAVMKEKEIRLRTLEGEIIAIDAKKKVLEGKEKISSDAKKQEIVKELAKTEAEIIKVKSELEAERRHLAELEKEDLELKKKKEMPQQGNEGLHAKAEIEILQRQKIQKDHDMENIKREHDALKREIMQLEKDKVKLEADVRKLEMESR
jgi:hypothetical protein